MTTSTGGSGTTEDERAFLQRRLSQYGLAGAAMGGIAMIFQLQHLTTNVRGLACIFSHAAGIAVMLAMWGVGRARLLSERTLRAVDAAGSWLGVLTYGLMGYFIAGKKENVGPGLFALMVLLIATYIVFARAALLPSTTRRTLAVTILCFVATLPVAFVHTSAARSDTALHPGGLIAGMAIWWLLTTTLASVTSGVIYGLHRDVKRARAFGQYHLVEKIGEGGMGVVYRARHRMLRRDTALKILPPARHSAGAIARFEREVQLTAQLSHPNTVTVFDYGRTPEGLFYYTMELLEGATLEDIVAGTGPLPPARVARILTQVAGALAEAHALGMVHRDVKPSNIMLCERGGEVDVAKVLDFGLVRESVTGRPSLAVTGARDVLGTPLYMSPEAITAPEAVTGASDLYSLGAVAVLLLTGKPLFAARSMVEVCSHHLHTAPAAPSASVEVPEALEALVLACLAKSADHRPKGARALHDALAALTVPGWSQAEARAWWETHRTALHEEARSRLTTSGGEVGATLDVDVARRLLADGASSASAQPAAANVGVLGF